MGAATRQAPPKIQKRQDPKGARLDAEDGIDPNWAIVNQDPALHYIWANENPRSHQSVDYYESRGYELVQSHPDAARPYLGAKRVQPGQPFIREGMVLMCAKKADVEALNAPRLQRYDAMERAFIKSSKAGLTDTLRGMGGNRGLEYMRPDPELTRISDAESEVDFS